MADRQSKRLSCKEHFQLVNLTPPYDKGSIFTSNNNNAFKGGLFYFLEDTPLGFINFANVGTGVSIAQFLSDNKDTE